MLKDCKKYIDLFKAAKRRLEYIRNALTLLFALLYQRSEKHDDDDGISQSDEDDNITDQEIFSTIINQMGEGESEEEWI